MIKNGVMPILKMRLLKIFKTNIGIEDLIERVSEGDIIMYVDSNESAEDWCEDNGYEYEFVER